MNYRKNTALLLFVSFGLYACAPALPIQMQDTRNPSLEFTQKVRGTTPGKDTIGWQSPQQQDPRAAMRSANVHNPQDPRVHMVKDYPGMAYEGDMRAQGGYPHEPFSQPSQNGHAGSRNGGVDVYRSSQMHPGNAYNGPLSLGDPGVGASLWQESRSRNELFRDYRAFKPMDLITIVVTENSEGRKEADTEVLEQINILAGITNLFNFETEVEASNPGLDTANLVTANTQNQYLGEGETVRRGTLTARISAMVVELLPSGVMRIEGEKIISVNNEEQIMVISGLIRPNDVNSINEVDSSKIANLRVDYFGRGVIGDAQSTGWFTRLMSKIWPF